MVTDPNLLVGDETRYDSSADAHMRLTRTVVRFEDKPIYIMEVGPDMRLLTWDMLPAQKFVNGIHSNDKRLDISSVPLGFINYNGEGYYASRSPSRSQKQGVNLQSLFYDSMTNGKSPYGAINNNDFIVSFGAMCRGEYPELKESVDMASHGKSCAFSKTWGLRKTRDKSIFVLHHKMNPVGIFVNSENLFLFQKDELNAVRDRSLKNVLASKKIGKYDVETSGL